MGYDTKHLSVTVSVSRHNSVKDRVHDVLWEDLVEQIKQLCAYPEYADISPTVS